MFSAFQVIASFKIFEFANSPFICVEWCSDTVIVMMRSTIISEWMLRSLYCSAHNITRARESELFHECPIYFHLFIFKWVYLPQYYIRSSAMTIFDWNIRAACHKKIINVSSRRVTPRILLVDPRRYVAEFWISRKCDCIMPLMRLLTRLTIFAAAYRRRVIAPLNSPHARF